MRRHACKECGKARPALAVEQGDEFCSTACAKRHYGTMPARDLVIRVPARIWRERLKRVS
jgi:hypothetical protein